MREKTVSLVRCGTASSPIPDGMSGSLPVAITTASKRCSSSPTTAEWGPVKARDPCRTAMPSRVKEESASSRAMSATTASLRAMSAAKSMRSPSARMPQPSP